MRELVKSMGSAGWALALLGAQQMTSFLSPAGWRRPEAAADPVDRVAGGIAETARRHLGGVYGDTFDTGDHLQRGMVDAFFGLLDPRAADPRAWAGGAQRMMDLPREMLRLGEEWLGGDGDCGCAGGGSAGGGRAGGGWGPMPPVPPGG